MLDTQQVDRRKKRHQRTKAEIVEAAWVLARDKGIGGFSLRDLAASVGMRAPSLYQYFPTKNALYDTMYADGYQKLKLRIGDLEGEARLSRAEIKAIGREYFGFCTEDPVRYQLMCERPVPGFAPSADSVTLAEHVMRIQVHAVMASLGVEDAATIRLFAAINSGVVTQQNATNPGGNEWMPIMDRALDMFLEAQGSQTDIDSIEGADRK
jgi:AcrR family transcriptional regulator